MASKLLAPAAGARTHGRALATVVVTAAVMLAGAASAQAAPTWLSPVRVGPITEPSCLVFFTIYECDAEIAVAANGTAYLATAHYDGTAANKRRVSVSVRPPGGSFGPRQFLSPPGENSAGIDGTAVDIAVDRNGNATVVWAYSDTTLMKTVVQAAYKPASASTFRPSETLSNLADNADAPSVAVADNGGAVVIWRKNAGAVSTIQRAFRNPGALTFGSQSDISSTGTSFDSPQVVMAPNGNAAAIWRQDSQIFAIPRPAGQPFTTAQRLQLSQGGANPVNDKPDIAIAPTGQVTAIWRYDNDTASPNDAIIRSRERSVSPNFASGSWSGLGTVTAPGEIGDSPSVAVSAQNTAVAVWSGNVGGETTVRAAVRTSGSSFTDHDPISGPQATPFAPQVEFSPQGLAVATWSLWTGAVELVQSARRAPGGSFGGVDIVMPGTPFPNFKGVWFRPPPTVSFDAEGNAFATWIGRTQPGGTDRNFVEVAGFDAAPPRFVSLGVPGTGATGGAVRMSASVADRLTSPTVSWNFGDGGTAAGHSVAHAYRAPGVYTVTAQTRDAVGNETTTTRTIQIANAAGIDADRDGFVAGVDCNDSNASIRPGAREIRGNNVDENCDGTKLPFFRIRVTIGHDFAAFSNGTRLSRFQVKGVPRRSTVKATCKVGKGKCPGKARKAFTKRRASKTVSLKKRYVGVFLPAGAKITVRVTKPRMIGAVKVVTIRKRKAPKITDRCLPPGKRKPSRC